MRGGGHPQRQTPSDLFVPSRGPTRAFKTLLGLVLSFCSACGPSPPAGPDIDHEQLGHLEFAVESGVFYYRNGDRIEYYEDGLAYDNPPVARCGHLRPDAYAELLSSIAALDPDAAYAPPAEVCEALSELFRADAGKLDLQGFTQSPFDCVLHCCSPELQLFTEFYLAVWMELIRGAPLPADHAYTPKFDFDRPCDPVHQGE